MNRMQFMRELSHLLSDISEAEREEALEYYENYFEDAGAEREAEVIRELGSPGKVAAIIKADLSAGSGDYGEYTERGYTDTRAKEEGQMPGKYTAGRSESRAERGYQAGRKNRNPVAIGLIILGLVILSPFLVGATGGILGVVIAIALIPFLAVFAVGACVLGFFAGAAACVAAGISLSFTYPGAGVLTLGIGCLFAAAAILSVLILVWSVGTALPWILRKVTDGLHNLIHKEEKRKDGAEI